MIDTVKLILDKSMFWVIDVSLFQKERENAARGYFTLVQNPTKSELLNGIYKPRLTLTKRFNASGRYEPTLSIEASLPKLIYSNNFDELEEADFEKIVQTLKQRLKDMGVGVFEHLLVTAPVSTIHYSKNIPLTDYSDPSDYITKIYRANINKRLDLGRTDFNNEGRSLKYRASSFEVAFYDKLKDLKQAKVSEKRAEESDNAIQLNLFDTLSQKKPFEVLRMEVRLNTRKKIAQILGKIGANKETTFKALFSKDTTQKVLLHYLDEIESGYSPLLLFNSSNPRDFLIEFMAENPKAGYRKTIQMLGLHVAIDQIGIREFRQITERFGEANWYKINGEIKDLSRPTQKSPFLVLRNALVRFEPLQLVDFQG